MHWSFLRSSFGCLLTLLSIRSSRGTYICSSWNFLRYASFSSGVMLGWWAGLLPAVAGEGGRMGVAGAGEVTPDCCAG